MTEVSCGMDKVARSEDCDLDALVEYYYTKKKTFDRQSHDNSKLKKENENLRQQILVLKHQNVIISKEADQSKAIEIHYEKTFDELDIIDSENSKSNQHSQTFLEETIKVIEQEDLNIEQLTKNLTQIRVRFLDEQRLNSKSEKALLEELKYKNKLIEGLNSKSYKTKELLEVQIGNLKLEHEIREEKLKGQIEKLISNEEKYRNYCVEEIEQCEKEMVSLKEEAKKVEKELSKIGVKNETPEASYVIEDISFTGASLIQKLDFPGRSMLGKEFEYLPCATPMDDGQESSSTVFFSSVYDESETTNRYHSDEETFLSFEQGRKDDKKKVN